MNYRVSAVVTLVLWVGLAVVSSEALGLEPGAEIGISVRVEPAADGTDIGVVDYVSGAGFEVEASQSVEDTARVLRDERGLSGEELATKLREFFGTEAFLVVDLAEASDGKIAVSALLVSERAPSSQKFAVVASRGAAETSLKFVKELLSTPDPIPEVDGPAALGSEGEQTDPSASSERAEADVSTGSEGGQEDASTSGSSADEASDSVPAQTAAASETRDERASGNVAGTDSDGDGLVDSVDECPERAEDRDGVEDGDGCPEKDADGDGIPDERDECPEEPEDMDGVRDDDGCPEQDADGDGIPDEEDECPERPEDIDGIEDEDGCPEDDADGDEIPDAQDECPLEAEDFDGVEDEDGCPEEDADGDGIPDERDECPEQPEDMDGIEDADGCPEQDADQDGVADVEDECPTTGGPNVGDTGCPRDRTDEGSRRQADAGKSGGSAVKTLGWVLVTVGGVSGLASGGTFVLAEGVRRRIRRGALSTPGGESVLMTQSEAAEGARIANQLYTVSLGTGAGAGAGLTAGIAMVVAGNANSTGGQAASLSVVPGADGLRVSVDFRF